MRKPILYAEDDESDAFFMRRALSRSRLSNPLIVVDDGREAINYLNGAGEFADRNRYPLPCLVFLDLKLPQISGLEVLEWIRRQPTLRAMLVVVLTSSNEDKGITAASRLGASSFLAKPPTALKIKELIDALGSHWCERDEIAPPPASQAPAS